MYKISVPVCLMVESEVLPRYASALCHSGSHYVPPRCGSQHQCPLHKNTEKYAKAKLCYIWPKLNEMQCSKNTTRRWMGSFIPWYLSFSGKATPCIQLMNLKASLKINRVANIIIALSCNSWKSLHRSSSISLQLHQTQHKILPHKKQLWSEIFENATET